MTIQYIACAKNDNEGEQITRNFLMSSLVTQMELCLGTIIYLLTMAHENAILYCSTSGVSGSWRSRTGEAS